MWLIGTPAKRGLAYFMTGLIPEMDSGRISSSRRRLVHLRITPSSSEQEDLILLRY